MRMRGLPFQVKKEDILFFFSEYPHYPDSVKIGKNSDNTKTGEGAILFKSENDCKRAFNEK